MNDMKERVLSLLGDHMKDAEGYHYGAEARLPDGVKVKLEIDHRIEVAVLSVCQYSNQFKSFEHAEEFKYDEDIAGFMARWREELARREAREQEENLDKVRKLLGLKLDTDW